MSRKTESTGNYGPVSRINHWVIALAIIGMLAFGIYLENIAPPGPEKGALVNLHKAFGVLVLLFGLWRVIWRLALGFMPDAAPMPSWQKLAALAVHWVLLAGIVIMPLSGLVGSYYAGRAIDMFGILTIPGGPEVPAVRNAAFAVHGLFANVMIAAILMHVAGALKHHFIDKDTTLLRMVGRA